MTPYILVCHTTADHTATERFCRTLAQYGFRYSCVDETTTAADRAACMAGAAYVVTLTSPDAVAGEWITATIHDAEAHHLGVLRVRLGDNALDDAMRSEGEAAVPFPPSELDKTGFSLFVHRALVRHLARETSCFSTARCVDDRLGEGHGYAVTLAVRAHAGDAGACYALARLYERGHGVPSMESEYAAWMDRAAALGVPDARIRMGIMRLEGQGVEVDAEEAYRLFTLAADNGDARGSYHCALCYLHGLGVLKDPEHACRHMKNAARAGYAPALFRLGLMYRDGVGTKTHFAAALRCFYEACRRSAAEEERVGDGMPDMVVPSLYGRYARRLKPITMRELRRTRLTASVRRRVGREPTSEEIARAFLSCRLRLERAPEDTYVEQLLHPAISEGQASSAIQLKTTHVPSVYGEGHSYSERAAYEPTEAAEALGCMLADGCPTPDGTGESHLPRPARALPWYRYALCRGGTGAVCRLANAYRRGLGVPSDAVRAARLYRIAAEAGDVRGQFALAVCHERGLGVSVDLREAVRYYELAARAGHAAAANNLGGCYEFGRGVTANPITAVEWYTRAAAEGQPEATCRLGLCYEQGRGVSQDRDRAVALYRAAARGGHAYAMYRLGLFLEHGYLAPSVVAEGNAPGMLRVTEDEVSVEADSAGVSTYVPRYSEATRLWRSAALAGLAEAAYALAVCYAAGRGVRASAERSFSYLRRAAKGGSIPACYRLGMCYMDGRGTLPDHARARAAFARAIDLWEEMSDAHHAETGLEELLPAGAVTVTAAVGGALYMLGYCTMYRLGSVDAPASDARRSSRLPDEPPAESERFHRAVALWRRAAALDHIGALTALGDLHIHGLLSSGEPAEAEELYAKAARLGRERSNRESGKGAVTEAIEPEDRSIHAWMSQAADATRKADVYRADGDTASLELAYGRAWRAYAAAAGQGSADALVGMASGAYYGHGTPRNLRAAMWFLEHAEKQAGGRLAAFLWLGDCRLVDGEGFPTEADEAYRRALAVPYVDSECGAYVPTVRRRARMAEDRRAHAEALYRLAVLRATRAPSAEARDEAFGYLVDAIRMGHGAAREDLARMYAYEAKLALERVAHETTREARRRAKAGLPPPLRSHTEWVTDYYTARRQVPVPFRYEMRMEAEEPPEHVVVPVTDEMYAAVFNYLGDCFYDGNGLPASAENAVACYREVVALPLRARRGEPLPRSVTWAHYSLGWCLLHGVGAPQDPRAAVTHLTVAARDHAEAAFLLAVCVEHGTGVDAPDDGEAIRYYRRALKGGYRAAEPKVYELEKRLKDAAE